MHLQLMRVLFGNLFRTGGIPANHINQSDNLFLQVHFQSRSVPRADAE